MISSEELAEFRAWKAAQQKKLQDLQEIKDPEILQVGDTVYTIWPSLDRDKLNPARVLEIYQSVDCGSGYMAKVEITQIIKTTEVIDLGWLLHD